MGLTSFIIGSILSLLGMNEYTRKYLFRFILSLLSTYPILKLFYPKLYLWGYKDYLDNTLFDNRLIELIGSNLFYYSLLCAVICYIFFYVILYKIVSKYLYHKLGDKYKSVLKANGTIDDVNNAFSMLFIKAYKFSFNYSLIGFPTKKMDTTILENDVKSMCADSFCLTIHLIFIVLFTINFLNVFSLVICFIMIINCILYLINGNILYEYRKEHLLKGIEAYNQLVK